MKHQSLPLERILHSQGFGSRKHCRTLIYTGEVSVAGAICEDPRTEFPLENLQFEVSGEAWSYHAQAYLALYKPAGFECSHAPKHHQSVFSLLPAQLVERGVQCVGRLDEDTTGLLLLSDDGQFIHRLSSGKRAVPKVYEVRSKHPLTEEMRVALLAGVMLHDEDAPVAATQCELIGDDPSYFRLTITSGKYHQVKRMVAAVGNRVEGLHRIVVGDYTLPSELKPGQWCWLKI